MNASRHPAPAPPRTRLAPTPSGRLHLGNAYSFVLAWLWARNRGGSILLRIEDTDTTRSRPEWIEDVFRDLEWLGLDWDEGPQGPGDLQSRFFQSSLESQARYRCVLREWIDRGLVFPCSCTRREASIDAPQVARIGESDLPGAGYSGRCRKRLPGEATPSDSWRLALPHVPSRVEDLLQAPSTLEDLSRLGAPVLQRADGCYAYHLAVCVDDHDQGVDTVVRGRDLHPWSHLHSHLHHLLGSPPPRFMHHGLLGGPQGERLAKRIGSTSLTRMRESGFDVSILLGRLKPLLHPGASDEPCSLAELASYPSPTPSAEDTIGPNLETP